MLIFDDTKPWEEKLSFYSYDIKRTDNLISINKSSLKFVEVHEEEPLKNECVHFLDAINHNAQFLTDALEGLKVVEVLSYCSNMLKN